MNKPKALLPGDKVAIVSLSSGMLGEEFARHQLKLGIKRLNELRLKPVFMKNSLKGIEYLKKHPEKRAQDLKEAFMDESIKGIICAIGGDDTYRLLPYLLEDKEFMHRVKKTPKLFTGYSDTTINHLMLYKLGMVSFYGPNFICDLAELDDEMLPYTKKSFQGYFKGKEPKMINSSDVWYEERSDFSANSVGTKRISHEEIKEYEILQGSGSFKGKLLGGCIESLYDILSSNRYKDQSKICEKYSIFPSKQEWRDKILFLETSEEKPTPKLLELELLALKKKGVFEVISGILIGKPQNEKYYEEYKEVYCKVIKNTRLPILYNVNFGHAYPKCIIPYGIETEVNMNEKTIKFKESLFV